MEPLRLKAAENGTKVTTFELPGSTIGKKFPQQGQVNTNQFVAVNQSYTKFIK